MLEHISPNISVGHFWAAIYDCLLMILCRYCLRKISNRLFCSPAKNINNYISCDVHSVTDIRDSCRLQSIFWKVTGPFNCHVKVSNWRGFISRWRWWYKSHSSCKRYTYDTTWNEFLQRNTRLAKYALMQISELKTKMAGSTQYIHWRS